MHNLFSSIHSDFLIAQELAYEPSGLSYKNLVIETENKDYGACEFTMNDQRIKFRIAKITPKKIGQFVTFWKRIGNGPILPYDISDEFDLLIVSTRNAEQLGQFVFTKSILCERDIVSKEGKGGKRAMRVYSPWDVPENACAKKTQAWQCSYFFEISPNKIDILRIQKLFFKLC